MAALATLVLCPLLFILMLLLRITMCSPVIFRQKRPGLKECRFWIYKFSTMGEAFDGGERPLPDVDRHIPFGQWLRTTSLDEIPELFNVLRGEMSLVGPRPLRMEYLSRYSSEQSRRHDVKPDISGRGANQQPKCHQLGRKI